MYQIKGKWYVTQISGILTLIIFLGIISGITSWLLLTFCTDECSLLDTEGWRGWANFILFIAWILLYMRVFKFLYFKIIRIAERMLKRKIDVQEMNLRGY